MKKPSNNGDETAGMADRIKQSRDMLEAHKQARLEGFRNELQGLCQKYDVRLGTRQLIVDGTPGPVEITVNLNG